MARDFDGTNDALYRSSPVSTATDNFTFACWVDVDSTSGEQVIFNNGHDNLSGYSLEIESASWCMLINGLARHNTGTLASTGAQHIAMRRLSTTWQFYLNGSASGTTTTTNPGAPAAYTTLACQQVDGGALNLTRFFNGRIAEAGFWEAGLDTSEIAALGKGLSPNKVRPASLVGYWPLWGRTSPEPDLWSGTGLTLNDSPAQADHPKMFRGRRRKWVPSVTAAGGGGGTSGNLLLLGVG